RSPSGPPGPLLGQFNGDSADAWMGADAAVPVGGAHARSLRSGHLMPSWAFNVYPEMSEKEKALGGSRQGARSGNGAGAGRGKTAARSRRKRTATLARLSLRTRFIQKFISGGVGGRPSTSRNRPRTNPSGVPPLRRKYSGLLRMAASTST